MASLAIVKSSDKDYLLLGNNSIITYMLQINNIGSTSAIDVILKDTIQTGSNFICGSVSVNGVQQTDANPETGINLGKITPNSSFMATFDVEVDSKSDISQINNYATVNFVDEVDPTLEGSAISNELIIPVVNIKMCLCKSVDKDFALLSDILNFTISIINNGNTPLSNLIFKDVLPDELEFVASSVRVNGVVQANADPNIGFNIGTLSPLSTNIVAFQAVVREVPCSSFISNSASVVFEYSIPLIPSITSKGSARSNTVNISVGPTSFKQLVVNQIVKIPVQKPDAIEILSSNIDIEILNLSLVNGLAGVSCEGTRLTGNKLIVNGKIKQLVEYLASGSCQSVHAAEFDIIFNTFIVVPENFVLDSNTKIKHFIEDIYTQLLNKRTISNSITLFLQVVC